MKWGQYVKGALATLAFISVGFCSAVHADVTMAQKQVPGYYRLMLNQFEITALHDGAFEMEISHLQKLDMPELKALLAKDYIDGDKLQTSTNAYIVNTGTNLVLIDTGCGNFFGPSMGRLLENLKASGYTPDQIDTILLTHMHPDHLGGLIDANGQRVFKNAKIYANQLESDFWLVTAAQNEKLKGAYESAQKATAPYREANQWATFQHKEEVIPGIRAISVVGHTPGHTIFRLKSGEDRFFILGDVIHSHTVQFARPDVSIDYDVDQTQAVESRIKVFNLAVKYKWKVAAMHLPYPGIGQIRGNADGTFNWIPLELKPN